MSWRTRRFLAVLVLAAGGLVAVAVASARAGSRPLVSDRSLPSDG